MDTAPNTTQQPDAFGLDITRHKQLVSAITQRFESWKTARRPIEARWRACWEAYLCQSAKSASNYSGSSNWGQDSANLYRPILFEAVEAIHANLLNAMFPSDERFFSVIGKTETDHQRAKTVEAFLRSKLEGLGFTEKYARFLKQAIITGSSIASVPWRKTMAKTVQYVPKTRFGLTLGLERQLVDTLVENGPDFDVLDMFDVVLDPNEPEFERTTLIRRLQRPLFVIEKTPAYTNTEGLRPGTPQGTEHDSQQRARRQAFGWIDHSPNTQAQPDTVELLEAWGTFELDGQRFENYVAVVANGERLIRFEPNPYENGIKPFVFTSFISVPNEIYGIGAIEKALGLQQAINTLTNQKLDVINLSINNPFTYRVDDDVFDPATVVTRPGALIPVKDHDTLRPIQYLNNYTVAFDEIADLKAEVQEATGAFKYFTGGTNQPADIPRTATEVSVLVSGGSQKFGHFVAHLENTSLEVFLRMVFDHARQFMTEPETLRITSPSGQLEFLEVLPELIRTTSCTFKIDGSQSAFLRGQELASLVQFIDLVRGDPEMRQRVNIPELYRRVYRRLGFRDEEEIFMNFKDNPLETQPDLPPFEPPIHEEPTR